MIRTLLLSFLLIFCTGLSAQTTLPNYRTKQEIRTLNPQRTPPSNQFNPSPPPAPVRTMGEWEEVQALVITWTGYQSILREITRAAVEECTVIIVTETPTSVANYLSNNNVPLDNVVFLNKEFDSVWIRDYGPWSTYQNDVDSLTIIDWIYNRPRPDDDLIPAAVAELLGLPFYEATQEPDDLIHTGGNHLQDGMYNAFASDLILDENLDKTAEEIQNILAEYMGADNFVMLPKLPFDIIHHIDMHMRFIDEETIIFGEYPEGVADGPQIEENIRLIKTQLQTYFGNRYEIIRVPMPPDQFDRYPDEGGYYRTYTNAIFINKTILVPIYEEQYDTIALRIYEENLPGYNVVGIDCNQIIPAAGAIHCISKLVGSDDPLLIAHPRLRDTYDTDNDYPVQAMIKHLSGIAAATLHYRTPDESDYTPVSMTLTGADTDTWTAAIPAQPAGTEVHYYIEATANSGKQQVRPLVAPEGYFRFHVRGLSAPVADFFYDLKKTCTGQDIQFYDESEGIVDSRNWSFPGGTPATSTELNPMVSYEAPGVYDILLTVSNDLGEDTRTKVAEIIIETGVEPFFEDFSGGPDDSWEIDNPQQDNAEWMAVGTGNCDGTSFRMNNYNFNTRNTNDYFRARFDMDDLTEATLSFDVAYAPFPSATDALRVNIILCDGQKIQLYSKYGEELATAPATQNAFIPEGCGEWRHEEIDLSDFADQTIVIEFENVGGYGNMLYVDNVDISSPDIPNQAPVILLTSPVDGTLYQDELPALSLEASAGDTDGQVAFVTFFVNGDSIGLDAQSPYELIYMTPDYGEYEVTARATDDDSAEGFSETATVTVEETVDIDELEGESIFNYRLYPNPAKDKINISFRSEQALELEASILDPLGRIVWQRAVNIHPGLHQQSLDVSSLSAGAYILMLHHPEGQSSRKVVIMR